MGWRKRGLLWGGLAALCIVTTAGAEDEPEADVREEKGPVRLGLVLGTTFPLSGTVEAQLELPAGLYLSGGLGVMPQLYGDAVNRAMVAFGAWPANVGNYVVDRLGPSSVQTATLGWRPPGGGFFLELDAARLQLSASADVLEATTTFAPAASALVAGTSPSPQRIEANLELALVGGQIGWLWDLDPLFFKLGLGAMTTVQASSELDVAWSDGQARDPAGLQSTAQRWLESRLRRNVTTPTASFSLGFRLL